MKASFPKALLMIVMGVALAAMGCGGVSGNTYQSEGGIAQIEFQSGGKANVSLGGQKMACTYVEESKTVTIDCQGDKSVFTIDKDGKLNPPPGSILGPLTKK